MRYSNFIILLARQRSGTNALRSILGTHPHIFCLDEVFNLPFRHSEYALTRDTNFFSFLTRYAHADIYKMFPDKHETLFLDFLEYLRCFSSKRYIVLDVKYNTTHFLAKTWLDSIVSPYFFELIEAHRLTVFRLTRKNYLRYVVSVLKAWRSGRYLVPVTDVNHEDGPIWLEPQYVLNELDKCYREDQIIEQRFSAYDKHLSLDYAELFPNPDGVASNDLLSSISGWLGVPGQFTNQCQVQKQSYLALAQTIENFEQVAKALTGTRFEYCLEDEAIYR